MLNWLIDFVHYKLYNVFHSTKPTKRFRYKEFEPLLILIAIASVFGIFIPVKTQELEDSNEYNVDSIPFNLLLDYALDGDTMAIEQYRIQPQKQNAIKQNTK